MDYDSPLARKVAGAVWSGLSRAALDSGESRISASWSSIAQKSDARARTDVRIFAVGEDRPDAIDALPLFTDHETWETVLYGVIVAAPEAPNPLVGPLLYQGVEHLKGLGIRSGLVEPAVLRPAASECDSYARRILQRLVG